ncbi:SHOCT domain-containing protein [Amycolatopsis tucumanensis]|uniref:SHOCT domain-containing protein n=1 Tax=Amycolatopsis tucumanensis TaxID=401106 RepID=A0ABP7HDS3_9PSEU|nr:SHOCT domain-containing protein [Amycolatopsis tucumanensis]MCF6423770.1 SHOCT domain-containing protein [Amycolatopsis tucumanensis]
MMYWYGNGMSGWGVALMTVGNVLFWGLVIIGGIALFRVLQHGNGFGGRARPSPEELLAERFARGEIDEQTYRRDVETLRLHNSGADR